MTIETVYTSYKPYFIEILKSRGYSEEKSVTIFQEAVVSLFHKEKDVTTTLFDSEIKRKIHRYVETLTADRNTFSKSLSESQKQLLKQFKNLPKSQQEILKLYYYKNLSVTEIAAMKHQKSETISEAKERAVKRLQH